MAKRQRFEFVEELAEDYKCPVCYDVVYEAKETRCCGHYLCRWCANEISRSRTSKCPQCRDAPLHTQDSLFVRRKLRSMHIYCINKDCCTKVSGTVYPINPNDSQTLPDKAAEVVVQGCDWSGELNDLQSHLDNHCLHAPVPCRYNCDSKLRCQNEADHEAVACPKRPFSCWFCEMERTAEEIDNHATDCNKRPIKCPNDCSPALLILKEDLQQHLNECPLQEVSCELFGCDEKILRKESASHVESSVQKHLMLVTNALSDLIAKQGELQQELTDTKKLAEVATKRLNILSELELAKLRIVVPRVEQRRVEALSNPFYIMGYCMKVRLIFPTRFMLMVQPGRYDQRLPWPLEAKISLSLLPSDGSNARKELVYNSRTSPPYNVAPTEPVNFLRSSYGRWELDHRFDNTPYLHKNGTEFHLLVTSATFF